jgi:hypothetical protein
MSNGCTFQCQVFEIPANDGIIFIFFLYFLYYVGLLLVLNGYTSELQVFKLPREQRNYFNFLLLVLVGFFFVVLLSWCSGCSLGCKWQRCPMVPHAPPVKKHLWNTHHGTWSPTSGAVYQGDVEVVDVAARRRPARGIPGTSKLLGTIGRLARGREASGISNRPTTAAGGHGSMGTAYCRPCTSQKSIDDSEMLHEQLNFRIKTCYIAFVIMFYFSPCILLFCRRIAKLRNPTMQSSRYREKNREYVLKFFR